mgnify:CR=1 FL=1
MFIIYPNKLNKIKSITNNLITIVLHINNAYDSNKQIVSRYVFETET